MSNNLCSWRDANSFFSTCAEFAGDSDSDRNFNLDLARRLESPIELVMFAALGAAAKKAKFEQTELLPDRELIVDIQTAQPVGRYRADIVVVGRIPGWLVDHPPVVVECDGFNYHDRTRDQARHDRERDRYMLHRGILVMRFTGEEITEAPFACAAEVLSIAHGRLLKIDRDDPRDGSWPVFSRQVEAAEFGRAL